CEAFHAAVEKHFVPLLHEILSRRTESLGLETLRPWDTAADPSGRRPLRPFSSTAELTQKMEAVLSSVDDQLGAQFRSLHERGLLDIDSRKGKAPGGYQSLLGEARAPFIFMNAVGVADDVVTLCHESGHAVHAIAAGEHGLFAYRHAPIEFSEVASFGMEMLAGERLGPFYEGPEFERARRDYIESKITLFPWICIIDAFQLWLYRNPSHSRAERTDAWLGIHERFNGGAVDWSGLRDEQAYLWQRQPHLFTTALYYIEYGIALTGALQLWQHARRDWTGTVDRYKAALALGGSKPLPELFAAAGLEFDFSEATLAPLAKFLRSSWLGTADA
ncbi:MAG: M3 family metallopeptidase, partial [Candidatus Hydrogenedentota bacterium]